MLDQDLPPPHRGHRRLDPEDASSSSSTRWTASTRTKLLLLLAVASLSLASIVVISEQLISRHLLRSEQGQVKVEVDIMTLERWAERVKGDYFPLETANDGTSNTIVEDEIFWSSSVEAAIPPGPGEQEVQDILRSLREARVTSVRKPDWLHCGRGKNRFVEMGSRSHACVRNRGRRHPELVQGEVMAFYLARMIGIGNTPVVALSKVRCETQTVFSFSFPFVSDNCFVRGSEKEERSSLALVLIAMRYPNTINL